MKPFLIHTVHDCAEPVASRLRATQSSLGFIPNLFGVLAESAPALAAFAALNSQFAKTTFSPTERELIALTVSTENRCGYCVAGHSAFAALQAVDEGIVQALREGKPILDPRLQCLRRFTVSLLRSRGKVSSTEIDQFLNAGYTQQQLLEVILGITVKVMSNLTSNAIGIPLDEAFAPYAWQAPVLPMPTMQPKAA